MYLQAYVLYSQAGLEQTKNLILTYYYVFWYMKFGIVP